MPIKEAVFQAIKKAFTTAPIFQHFDPNKECTLKTDSLDYNFATILSQPDPEGILWLVAFILCQHLSAECNYKINNKELPAIVRAF